jgi:ribosomal protein S4E
VNFRLLYDTNDRFALHKVVREKVSYKLCHLKKVLRGPKGMPHCAAHDSRTLHYSDLVIKVNDTVHLELASGKDPTKVSSSTVYVYRQMAELIVKRGPCMYESSAL